jgi:AraC-like DNA-binding protein
MQIKIHKTPNGTVRYPHHRHRNYEIMHYIRGRGRMWTEKGEIPFSPGQVVIIPPGLLHGSEGEEAFTNVSVECDFGGLLATDAPIALSEAEGGEGALLLGMIWNNRHGAQAYLEALCAAYVRYLLQRVEMEDRTSAAVKKILGEISEHAFDPEISVSALLRGSGYAEDHIRAVFKKEVGKTPLAFLTDLRMEHACHLIDVYKTALPLAEIAEKCGYSDYVYFSKIFKKHTHLSPRAYRDRK